MFQDNTVFIIGAGASQEFGLPVGRALMQTIKQNCKFSFDFSRIKEGPYEVFRAIQRRYPNESEERDARLRACAEICRAIDSAGSIDSFIDRNAHDPLIAEVGKLQIAFAIAKAEAKSKLWVDRSRGRNEIPWDDLGETWIDPFTYALFDGVRTNNVESIGKNITIISFNYDRCIEFYLIAAIERSFQGVSRQTAYNIVHKMNIIHPYGTLGKLPVGMFGEGDGVVAFAPDLDRIDLYQMSDTLVTWSETVEDAERINSIKKSIANARSIIFMGFAFAKQNMDLLSCFGYKIPKFYKNVYSSGFGIPEQITNTLKENISDMYNDNKQDINTFQRIRIENSQKCYEFLRTHLYNLMQ